MIKVGEIYNTKNYGKCIVIKRGEQQGQYLVKFLNTNGIGAFWAKHIKTGSIRDPYAYKVAGVGYTGDIPTTGEHSPYYSIWHDMMHRCYDPNNKRAHAYRNVYVTDEWRVFEHFYNDCKKLPGYDHDKIAKGELVIDKDSKQRFALVKVYSPDTCVWLTKHENNQMQDGQQRRFIATSPTGEKFEDYNITDFARNHDLSRRNISAVLHGRNKTTQGWGFDYAD